MTQAEQAEAIRRGEITITLTSTRIRADKFLQLVRAFYSLVREVEKEIRKQNPKQQRITWGIKVSSGRRETVIRLYDLADRREQQKKEG